MRRGEREREHEQKRARLEVRLKDLPEKDRFERAQSLSQAGRAPNFSRYSQKELEFSFFASENRLSRAPGPGESGTGVFFFFALRICCRFAATLTCPAPSQTSCFLFAVGKREGQKRPLSRFAPAMCPQERERNLFHISTRDRNWHLESLPRCRVLAHAFSLAEERERG